MSQEFSDLAIREYLPVMRAICATLEVEVVDYPSLDRKDRLFVSSLEKEFELGRIRVAFMIFNIWLKGTCFVGGPLSFQKTKPEAKWSDMISAIRSKIEAHSHLTSTERTKTESIVKLPKGTMWEDLELKFKDKHTVTILCKGEFYGSYDYTILGFSKRNTKSGKIDSQWKMLHLLALAGKYSATKRPTKSLFIEPLETTSNGCDQIKGKLSEKLKLALGVFGNPFYPYDPDGGYRPKFILTPEPGFRGNGELYASGSKLYEEKMGNVLEGADD